MAGAQPATRRLLTEATAAATYATPAAATTAATAAANTAVTAAVAALPKGVVSTNRGVNPVNVTLTAGRLYRITAHVQPSTNAAVAAGAYIRGQAGTTAPAVGGGTSITATEFSTITGSNTGTPSLRPSGVFAVNTTGAYSFTVNTSPATGTGSGFTVAMTPTEYVVEDIGATGAAGTGRAPGATL
jgi:hypothetical protein